MGIAASNLEVTAPHTRADVADLTAALVDQADNTRCRSGRQLFNQMLAYMMCDRLSYMFFGLLNQGLTEARQELEASG